MRSSAPRMHASTAIPTRSRGSRHAVLAHRPGLRRGRDRRPAGPGGRDCGRPGAMSSGWVEQELRSIVGHRQFVEYEARTTAGTRSPSARRRTCSARSSSWATRWTRRIASRAARSRRSPGRWAASASRSSSTTASRSRTAGRCRPPSASSSGTRVRRVAHRRPRRTATRSSTSRASFFPRSAASSGRTATGSASGSSRSRATSCSTAVGSMTRRRALLLAAVAAVALVVAAVAGERREAAADRRREGACAARACHRQRGQAGHRARRQLASSRSTATSPRPIVTLGLGKNLVGVDISATYPEKLVAELRRSATSGRSRPRGSSRCDRLARARHPDRRTRDDDRAAPQRGRERADHPRVQGPRRGRAEAARGRPGARRAEARREAGPPGRDPDRGREARGHARRDEAEGRVPLRPRDRRSSRSAGAAPARTR